MNNIRYKCDMTAMQVIEAEAYNLGDAKSTCTDLVFKRGTGL